MEITLPLIVTVAINLVVIGIAYGTLKAKIDDTVNYRKNCEQRFRDIEANHTSKYDALQQQLNAVNNSVNQMIGKLEMFFKISLDKE